MADYLIKGETLTGIADAIRRKTGSTEDIKTKDMESTIDSISTGTDTSDATATATDILSGKTAYVDGEKITGTIETVTQATPSIKIDPSGLITAAAVQTAGYVEAGTKTATKQLAFQAAKTITPSATSQVAVSSGYYVGGDVTVAGDANLVPTNIVNGKTIFGVTGTATVGSGSTDVEDSLVTRTVTTYINDRITSIGEYAFYGCNSLTTVSFPACKTIDNHALYCCSSLTTVSFPVCTTISNFAFYGCSSLTTVSFPACKTIDNHAFCGCRSLTTASFPVCTTIGSGAFYGCRSLTTASFPVCTTIGSSAFYGCSSLTTASFPVCTTIGSSAFYGCSSLTTASFSKCITIHSYAFRYCYSLTTMYLMTSTICRLVNSNAFSNAGITRTTGSIFVPASLLASYKTATNWAYFSTRFVGVE